METHQQLISIATETKMGETETVEQKRNNKRLLSLSHEFSHKIPGQMISHGIIMSELYRPDLSSKLALRSGDILVCGYPKSGMYIMLRL